MFILDNAQPLIEVSLFLDREEYVRKVISSWKVSATEIYSSITETSSSSGRSRAFGTAQTGTSLSGAYILPFFS